MESILAVVMANTFYLQGTCGSVSNIASGAQVLLAKCTLVRVLGDGSSAAHARPCLCCYFSTVSECSLLFWPSWSFYFLSINFLLFKLTGVHFCL